MPANETTEKHGKVRDILDAFVWVVPVFVVVAYVSNMEKALLAASATGALSLAASERWAHHRRAGFWAILILAGLANAVTVWLLPIGSEFKSSRAVAFAALVPQFLLLYWGLGRLGRSSERRLTDL